MSGTRKSSNRTFMELKLFNVGWCYRIIPVLIVSLWNWNKGGRGGGHNWVRSNRTFMELKWLSTTEWARVYVF